MKFTPIKIKENVNISKVSPITEFFELIIKVLFLIIFIYIFLALLVDYIAPKISIETELKLKKIFYFEREKRTNVELKVQKILDDLVKNSQGLAPFKYTVYILESKNINALALPGGNILVFTGLLKNIDSRNELAFVLAHELGHYYHRDHLRALGRNLIFLLISSVLFRADNPANRFITNAIVNTQMRFSQSQERLADLYALDLLYKTYGDVSSAIEFFNKMAKMEKLPKFFYVFSSHPYSKDRITAIKEAIKKRGYKEKRISGDTEDIIIEEIKKDLNEIYER